MEKQKSRLIMDTNLERQPVERLLDNDLMRLAALVRRNAFETLILRHQLLVFFLLVFKRSSLQMAGVAIGGSF